MVSAVSPAASEAEVEDQEAEAEAVETDRVPAEAVDPDRDRFERYRQLDSWRSQHNKSPTACSLGSALVGAAPDESLLLKAKCFHQVHEG